MSKSHTPGPWAWSADMIFGRDDRMVLDTGYAYGEPFISCKPADRALIAAAPDLLAFAEWVAGRDNGDGTITFIEREGKTYQEEAAKLVKKARGE